MDENEGGTTDLRELDNLVCVGQAFVPVVTDSLRARRGLWGNRVLTSGRRRGDVGWCSRRAVGTAADHLR